MPETADPPRHPKDREERAKAKALDPCRLTVARVAKLAPRLRFLAQDATRQGTRLTDAIPSILNSNQRGECRAWREKSQPRKHLRWV